MNEINDTYIYVIVALLPLSAVMLAFEGNPYQALIIRGILGAVAAMAYSVLGAADVALTEALMGTLLAITLYAVAVRSSLVMRLGVFKDPESEGDSDRHFQLLMDDFRKIFDRLHMRLEVVPYTNPQALERALMEKEVHTICAPDSAAPESEEQTYHTATRVRRLYDIMQAELSPSRTFLTYVNTPTSEEKHA